ncbi:hypothetical protein E1A91_D12G084400v1 [Gossypium mustelinum]|uniref:Endonuclease/exonuclease/phosphatase domain-containing protein n=1 Tax=Gossypium mustelinum TaxID=34275 RepID=A0A5D2SBL3_GOSMU|nr:hypothetical protein E1A91_D12G084400v1 [Gossypium mustelinum]
MVIFCWNCHGVGNPAIVRELKQLLVANASDFVFLCETKVQSNCFTRIRSMCRMESCVAVNSEGKSGGLALLWREGVKVEVQNFSKNHIDSLVSLEESEVIRFTSFYGNVDPNARNLSWELLRRVKRTVKEGWIGGGDFNAIFNNAEKDGRRKKLRKDMKDFSDILEELALVDVKTNNGWFTWSNNREGSNLVKERLDRFLISEDLVEKMPFINTRVVRQSKSDHEAIFLNTVGNKSEEKGSDHRLWFKYDACWAKEQEAKNIIKGIWANKNSDMMNKMDNVRKELGPWQYKRYRRMKYDINRLEKKIGKIMDGPNSVGSSNLLKTTRDHLGKLYDAEEKYWAKMARNQWLREGDMNTRYFHVRATGRKKKNAIDRLKDANGLSK